MDMGIKISELEMSKKLQFSFSQSIHGRTYSVGFHNGMEFCLSFLQNKEPKYIKHDNNKLEVDKEMFVEIVEAFKKLNEILCVQGIIDFKMDTMIQKIIAEMEGNLKK